MKNLFSFYGNIGRKKYILTLILITVLSILGSAPYIIFSHSPTSSSSLILGANILMILTFAIFAYIYTAASSKRLHDLGHSGWWQVFPIAFAIISDILYKQNPDFSFLNSISYLLSTGFAFIYLPFCPSKQTK